MNAGRRRGSLRIATRLRALLDRGRAAVRRDAVFGQVVANSGWLMSAHLVTMALSFVQSLIIARVLGPAQLGIVALVTVYASTVNQFVDSRVWEAAITYVIKYRERGEPDRAAAIVKLCYLVDAATAGLAFLIVFFTAGLASRLLVKDAQIAGLIQFYALSVLVSVPSGTSGALLRIDGQFDRLAYYEVGMSIFRLSGVVLIAALGQGIRGLLAVYVLTAAVGALALVYMSRHTARQLDVASWWRAPLRLLSGEYRRIMAFLIHTNLNGTSRILSSKADTLILGWLTTPSDVGLYKLARTVADPIGAFVAPAYNAVYPAMSGLVAQGDVQGVRSLQRKLSRTITALVFPVCATLTIVVVWAIPALFGREFQASVLMAQILLWQVIWTPMLWLPGLLLSMERARTLAGLNWLDAVVYVVLLLALVPQLGALGAAIATVLRIAIWTSMSIVAAAHANRQLQLRESVT